MKLRISSELQGSAARTGDRLRAVLRSRLSCGGYGAFEFLVALPLLLLFALVALQWVLVLHERSVIEYALQEAVRSGATGHASPAAIEAGLARGLEPLWATSSSHADPAERRASSLSAFRQARAEGWFHWGLLSPTPASFDDWSVAALDENGRLIPGEYEIPNDNLVWRQRHQQPRSGAVMFQGAAPVGIASGQSILDANLIKLEAYVGLALRVPLAGSMMGLVSQIAHGCSADNPTPPDSRCAVLLAGPRGTPRLLLHLSATTRMQSASRRRTGAHEGGIDVGIFSTTKPIPPGGRQVPSLPPQGGNNHETSESRGGDSPEAPADEQHNASVEVPVESVDQSVEIVASGACLSGCSGTTEAAGSCSK